jgi:hypothetical protein
VDCDSDEDETNDFTILRRQAVREWAGDGTHGEEGNIIQAISWPAPVRNDNRRANPSTRSRPQSPIVQTANIPPIGTTSVRYAQSQPQGSQVTRRHAQGPRITLTPTQIPPVVLSDVQIPRVVPPRPIAGTRRPQATQVLAQTPLTPSPRVQIPGVVQLLPWRSQRSQVTQPPRRSPPALVPNGFAAAQDIRASTQAPDMPLRPARQSVQWARSQVGTRRLVSFHTLKHLVGDQCSSCPCSYRQERSNRPRERR